MSPLSALVLYVLAGTIAVYALLVLVWQVQVLQGRSMRNPDDSVDDWHEQRTHYGIAVADITLACPAAIAGAILAIAGQPLGLALLGMVSFWFVWANTMTTATSLRFHKPRISVSWLVVYPMGILIGLAYIVWATLNLQVCPI